MVWLILLLCAFFLVGVFAPLIPNRNERKIAGSRNTANKSGVKIIINPKKIKFPTAVKTDNDGYIQYYLPLSYPLEWEDELPILWLLRDTAITVESDTDKSVSTLVWEHWLGTEQIVNGLQFKQSGTGQWIEFSNQMLELLSKLPVEISIVKLERQIISIFWKESSDSIKVSRVIDFLQKSNHYLSSISHFQHN